MWLIYFIKNLFFPEMLILGFLYIGRFSSTCLRKQTLDLYKIRLYSWNFPECAYYVNLFIRLKYNCAVY